MRISIFACISLFALLGPAAAVTLPVVDGWRISEPVYPNWQIHPLQAGAAATAGMSGKEAVYASGQMKRFEERQRVDISSVYGTLENRFSLAAWHGKRVRVTLRLKNEGDARAWTTFYVANTDGSGIAPTRVSWNGAGSTAWEPHAFVVDVADNADEFVVRVGIAGTGKVWVDAVTMEAVSAEAPSNARRFIDGGQPTRPRQTGTDLTPPLGPST